jgi:hypothetical protein
MKKLKAADGAAVSEREYERLKALQEGASAKEDVLKKLNKNSKRLPGDRAIPVPFPDLETKRLPGDRAIPVPFPDLETKRLPGDRAIPVPFPDLETKPEKKTEPETNAEKKAKRLEELRKEIEGKSKGGFIVGKGADYIKDLL